MGNLINTFKRFFSNKQTVTVLGVIAGVIVLWAFYSYRVNRATSPIRVPYAKEPISATEEITEENIAYTDINSAFLKDADIITNKSELVGKRVTTGTSVPAGGLFYRSQVVDKKDLPNTFYDEIEDGFTVYSLKVDNHSTYGNSIYPGDKIDLYIKATEDNTDKIIFGKFVESITVLGVRDSSGNNVFGSETLVPDELVFAVPDDVYELLMKATYISGITIIPVPRNKNYTTSDAQMVTSSFFEDYINAHSSDVLED